MFVNLYYFTPLSLVVRFVSLIRRYLDLMFKGDKYISYFMLLCHNMVTCGLLAINQQSYVDVTLFSSASSPKLLYMYFDMRSSISLEIFFFIIWHDIYRKEEGSQKVHVLNILRNRKQGTIFCEIAIERAIYQTT